MPFLIHLPERRILQMTFQVIQGCLSIRVLQQPCMNVHGCVLDIKAPSYRTRLKCTEFVFPRLPKKTSLHENICSLCSWKEKQHWSVRPALFSLCVMIGNVRLYNLLHKIKCFYIKAVHLGGKL